MEARQNENSNSNPFDFELLKTEREKAELSKPDLIFRLAQAGVRISRPGYDVIESGKSTPKLDFVQAVGNILKVDFFPPGAPAAKS